VERENSDESKFPESILARIDQALDQGQTLDAYALALQDGRPIEKWSGPDNMLLAARLARNLGGSELGWRLASEAYRQRPHLARFLTNRIYALRERRGIFAAWQIAQRFDQCQSETLLEKAEALVCRADLSVVFRDFENASSYFSEAQGLAPASPWVITECSGLWAERGQHSDALQYLDKALALQPYFRPAVQRKAHYLQALGRDEEALQLLESARGHLQHYAIALQLIVIYNEQENWGQSLQMLEEARRLAPLADKTLEIFFAMKEADARSGLGDWEGAAVQAEKAGTVNFYAKLALNLRSSIPPGRRVKIAVPYIQQEYNTCAPATLSAITAFWNRPIPQEVLIDDICYDGTTDIAQRRWAQKEGWYVREFKVTWDAATVLLDQGIPFILTTTEIESGHAQAVIGYDTVRRSLLMRDPSVRHHTEADYEEFVKHYEAVGPRGLLVLPQEMASLLAGIQLPESDLYDLHFKINCALE
jgi:tetratricopeptide (TPR) repeat protein